MIDTITQLLGNYSQNYPHISLILSSALILVLVNKFYDFINNFFFKVGGFK